QNVLNRSLQAKSATGGDSVVRMGSILKLLNSFSPVSIVSSTEITLGKGNFSPALLMPGCSSQKSIPLAKKRGRSSKHTPDGNYWHISRGHLEAAPRTPEATMNVSGGIPYRNM